MHYIPVGTFDSAIKLIDKGVFPDGDRVKSFAFLDLDVKLESIPEIQGKPNNELFQAYSRVAKSIKFLPFVPELLVVQLYGDNLQNLLQALRTRTQNQLLALPSGSLEIDATLTGGPQRKAAKLALSSTCEKLADQTPNRSKADYFELILRISSHAYFDGNPAEVMSTFGPVL